MNQEKIILGLEMTKSYYTGCDLLVLNSESTPQLARTVTAQERDFESRIAQWLAHPGDYMCALYPTESAVLEVANYLAEELGQHWLVSYFARRRQLWYTLTGILNTHPRSHHLVNQFSRTYVSEEQLEFASAGDDADRSSIILDSPSGRTAAAVPRAAAQRITSREAFARRVESVCSGPEVWREDPHALWNVKCYIRAKTRSQKDAARTKFHSWFFAATW